MKVYLATRTVGGNFGTAGLVRAIGGKQRVLAETEQVYPYGFVGAAVIGARELAVRAGWQIVEEA